ncbi:ATP-dependent RNA helicase DbpA [Granulosicoccus sp. 3-233]|uniref:ATP-dependent RNA helicase DbpA n=1 Tax=Granulosicoccus sp. 3-233 TaxID=3417969 RepID=UPI003D356D2F
MTSPLDTPFNTLPLRPELLASVESLEYSAMSAIQMQALPAILDKRDVLAQARTGSGKTAAFALGLLDKLEIQTYRTQALVLCPTRELADQVAADIRRLASALPNTRVLTLCGGKPMQAQLNSLRRDAHVIVGTPGRVLKHLEKGSLLLDGVRTLVLDEADRMLDMGFHDDIIRILDRTDRRRQTLLFSATYPDQIRQISEAVQVDPVEIRVESLQQEEPIRQVFYAVEENDKSAALLAVLQSNQPDSCIVFCNRKQHCQSLTQALLDQGYWAKALHGDLDQQARDESILLFANGSTSILVATDVAARGLDIDTLAAVINHDMALDPDTHVHRIGRTGRAGHGGLAISFVLPNEQYRLEAIEQRLERRFPVEQWPRSEARRSRPALPATVTLHINAGRKDKIRPGDIVGALTAGESLNKEQIGKITVQDRKAYVAVDRDQGSLALEVLNGGRIKGRRFKVRLLR